MKIQKSMVDQYLSIREESTGLYKSKGSKFLSFAYFVDSPEMVKRIMDTFRKKYHNARHVCYAYVLKPSRDEYRVYDDGEPSGTAGKPILGQINARELTNVLIIVVRYFGGVLLGTGGLISAYKEAAADALNQAEIITKTVECSFTIQFEYLTMNDVMQAIKESDGKTSNQRFMNICTLTCTIPINQFENLKRKLENIDNLKIIF